MLGKISPITYLIDMPDRHKRYRTVHVESMKIWTEPILSILYIRSVSSPEHDLPEYRTVVTTDISTLVHNLTSDKQKEVLDFLNQHSSVTKPHPGQTHLATHRVDTLDARSRSMKKTIQTRIAVFDR